MSERIPGSPSAVKDPETQERIRDPRERYIPPGSSRRLDMSKLGEDPVEIRLGKQPIRESNSEENPGDLYRIVAADQMPKLQEKYPGAKYLFVDAALALKTDGEQGVMPIENGKSVTIGRDNDQDRFPYMRDTVSREHLRLAYDAETDTLNIEDLNSLNGTVVRADKEVINPAASGGSEQSRSPEQQEDDPNRVIDREILRADVRTKLTVIERAKQAINKGDKLIAAGRNMLTAPKAYVRGLRLQLAERSLQRKNDRLASKHEKRTEQYKKREEQLRKEAELARQADELWVKSASSARVREKRQKTIDLRDAQRTAKNKAKLGAHKQRIDKKYNKRQSKINEYEAGKVATRRQKHTETTSRMRGRADRAEQRTEERERSIREALQEAQQNAEMARARKVLREALRGKENSASRHETNEIITDIFRSLPRDQLLGLGRNEAAAGKERRNLDAAKQRRGQVETQITLNDQMMTHAQERLADITSQIQATEQQQGDVQRSLPAIESHVAAMADAHGEHSEEYRAATQELVEAKARLKAMADELTELYRQSSEIPDRIAQLQLKTAELRATLHEASARVAEQEAYATRAQTDVDRQVHEILGMDRPEQANKKGSER